MKTNMEVSHPGALSLIIAGLALAEACAEAQTANTSNLVYQLNARAIYQPPTPDSQCLTPPMGWSEWNLFYGYTSTWYMVEGVRQGYNQDSVVGMMDAMRTNGMQALGYRLILPDVAMVTTRSNGAWVQNYECFPNGIPWLADYAHTNGFKFGMYGSRGAWHAHNNCDPTGPGRCGSSDYEAADAAQWAAWGMDYLKYDNMTPSTNTPVADYAAMRNALASCGRQVVFNICTGWFDPAWPMLAHTWRTSMDINRSWAHVTNNLYQNARFYHYAGPGHFNDPDMLEVGNNRWPNNTAPVFTPEEHFSHFALWCIMAAPLIAGNDVRHMDDYIASILMAPELIAVDQDPAGLQGHCVARDHGVEIWLKPLGSFGSGRCAVAIFNPAPTNAGVTVYWTDLLLRPGPASVRDLYLRQELGTFTDSFTTNVGSHATVMLGLTGAAFGEPCFLSDLVGTNLPGAPWSGVVRRDLSAHGQTMSLGSVPFLKGLGMMANASASFPLTQAAGAANADPSAPDGRIGFPLPYPPGRPTRFVADIGLDDASPPGEAVFHVLLDEAEVYQSRVLTNGSPVETVNLDVTDRASITLVVSRTVGNASANWGDARVLTHLPVPAQLSVRRVGSQTLKLSWPMTAAGYVLQHRSAAAGSDWQHCASPVTACAGQCETLVPFTDDCCLFRLAHP